MQQAAFTTTAFATAYSRPFIESRGWPKFPERLLQRFSSEQRRLHKRVLMLRNLIYAHSDVASRSIRPINIDGYATAIVALPPMRFTKEELVALQAMMSVLRESIKARKHQLLPFQVSIVAAVAELKSVT
jgi:hypothetical protein